jgi:hypothetical protein
MRWSISGGGNKRATWVGLVAGGVLEYVSGLETWCCEYEEEKKERKNETKMEHISWTRVDGNLRILSFWFKIHRIA